jgi:hypothetical protein
MLLIARLRPKGQVKVVPPAPASKETAQKRLGDATKLALVGCLACGFGSNGATTFGFSIRHSEGRWQLPDSILFAS